MTHTYTTLAGATSDAVKPLVETALHIKDEVKGLGRTASEKLDESRHAAATGLDRTASALHQGSQRLAGLADSAADKLTGTAKYLREHDVKSMLPDVTRMVRWNPALALLAAGAIGFAMGRTLHWRTASPREM